jgi:hypothetical protein
MGIIENKAFLPKFHRISITPLFSTSEFGFNKAENTAYKVLLKTSKSKAVLNEKPPSKTQMVELPDPVGGCIVPHDLIESRKHPDVRTARRAATIANLAKVISERDVSVGLRITLRTQARRLLALVERRLSEVSGLPPDDQA